ncbi:hypothetical protein F2Q69_00061946 [Brassica cretica]|uniref:Uncharacterized protein n=1 Tax=Brassica cretica TaxID=69181 RepID=A0A8S9RJ66_BRACR|nr:hypothetical protein F2Q69_00061946 [Brassica cretica]
MSISELQERTPSRHRWLPTSIIGSPVKFGATGLVCCPILLVHTRKVSGKFHLIGYIYTAKYYLFIPPNGHSHIIVSVLESHLCVSPFLELGIETLVRCERGVEAAEGCVDGGGFLTEGEVLMGRGKDEGSGGAWSSLTFSTTLWSPLTRNRTRSRRRLLSTLEHHRRVSAHQSAVLCRY